MVILDLSFTFFVWFCRGRSTVLYGCSLFLLLTFAGVVSHRSVTQPAASPSPEIKLKRERVHVTRTDVAGA